MREWNALLSWFQTITPLHGILFATLEALFPPLPLAAIVGVNVAQFGMLRGFLYSWIGSTAGCIAVFSLFHRLSKSEWVKRRLSGAYLRRARTVVDHTQPLPLFFLLMLPFTPSAFLNVAFGICGYSKKRYLHVLIPAKFIMLGSLSVLGRSVGEALHNRLFILISLGIFLLLYVLSKRVVQRYGDPFG